MNDMPQVIRTSSGEYPAVVRVLVAGPPGPPGGLISGVTPEMFVQHGDDAVQAAMDAMYARGGGQVMLSAKAYVCNNLTLRHGVQLIGVPIKISAANLYTDTGEGSIMGASRLEAAPGLTGDFITVDFNDADINRRPYNTVMKSILVDCRNQLSGCGIYFRRGATGGIFGNDQYSNAFIAEDVYVWHAAEHGVQIDGGIGATYWGGCYSAFSGKYGFFCNGKVYDTVLNHCFIFENKGGLWLKGNASARVTFCDIFTNRFDQALFDEAGHSGNGVTDSGQINYGAWNFIQNNDCHGLEFRDEGLGLTNNGNRWNNNHFSLNSLKADNTYDDIHIGQLGGVGLGVHIAGNQLSWLGSAEARVRNSIHLEALPDRRSQAGDCHFNGFGVSGGTPAMMNDLAWQTLALDGSVDSAGHAVTNKIYDLPPSAGGIWQFSGRVISFFRTNNTQPTTLNSINSLGAGSIGAIYINDDFTTIAFDGNLRGNQGIPYLARAGDELSYKSYDGVTAHVGIVRTTNRPNASGIANFVVNPSFRIASRGESFLNAQTGAFLTDGWRYTRDGAGAVVDITRQRFTPGEEPESGTPFYLRVNQTAAGSGANYQTLVQQIEDSRRFAGQKVWVSFRARLSPSGGVSIQIVQNFGQGGSAAVTTNIGTRTVGTAWAGYAVAANLPSLAGQTIGSAGTDCLQLLFLIPVNAVQTFEISDIQMTTGFDQIAFASRPLQLEEDFAAYYYQAKTVQAINGSIYVPFTPKLRDRPSGIDVTASVGTVSNATRHGFMLTHTASAASQITASAEYG